MWEKHASFETFTVGKAKIPVKKKGIRNILRKKRKSVHMLVFSFFQHPYMNAKMTKIVIPGPNAKKKSVFVKEIQQEMGNTVEVISNHVTQTSIGNRSK